MDFQGLGYSQLSSAAICSRHSFSLGLTWLPAWGFPQAMTHSSAPPTSWGLYCNLDFILTSSHNSLLGFAYRDSNQATHCLASVLSGILVQVFMIPPLLHLSHLHASTMGVILQSSAVTCSLRLQVYWPTCQPWEKAFLDNCFQEAENTISSLQFLLSNEFIFSQNGVFIG